MQGLGFPFSPEVAFMYNPNATAISKGCAVAWSTSVGNTKYYAMKWPEPEGSGENLDLLPGQTARTAAVTRNIPGITLPSKVHLFNTAGTGGRGIIGVAIENIAATSWGHVALSGMVDVRLGISQTITAGDALITTAAGLWVESAGADTATAIFAMALEAVTTDSICTAALCHAFIPPGIGFVDSSMGYNTA